LEAFPVSHFPEILPDEGTTQKRPQTMRGRSPPDQAMFELHSSRHNQKPRLAAGPLILMTAES
jgi:hypothetical protein